MTDSGRLVIESRLRGVPRAERFDVVVTVDRDGGQEVWMREQWQERQEVLLDEWSTLGYYRELELPVAETIRPARIQLVPLGENRGEHEGRIGHPA